MIQKGELALPVSYTSYQQCGCHSLHYVEQIFYYQEYSSHCYNHLQGISDLYSICSKVTMECGVWTYNN